MLLRNRLAATVARAVLSARSAMKRKVAMVLAAVVVAVSSAMGGTLPAKAEVNPYITEGTHVVNGREWRTECEAYSQTERCRTEIKATQVTEVKGKFVAKTGWFFNNLTYLPSARSLWKNNKLGYTNDWVDVQGRKWSTSCDTPSTGRNGCRTYAEARVVEAYQVNGKVQYRWATKSIFNNIVQFTIAAPVKPTPPTTVNVPDAGLRECINDELGNAAKAAITKKDAGTLVELDCTDYGIKTLTGLEHMSNLEVLSIDANYVKDLRPLQGLTKLEALYAFDNEIVDVVPVSKLVNLVELDLAENRITQVGPLAQLQKLAALDLSFNDGLTKVAPLAKLSALEELYLIDVPLTDKASLKPLTDRGVAIYFTEDDLP